MTSPIRGAVIASPEYPFKPVEAKFKLDQNESSEDFPSELKATVLQRLAQVSWNRYPDLHSDAVAQAIAAYEAWPAAGVVVTTGSNVLIALLTQLAGIGQRVITVKPNFALYALGANLLDAQLTEVPLRPDLSIDRDALISAIQAPGGGTGVIYLPVPQPPSGSLASMDDIIAIVEAAHGWLVVIDEAYFQFSGRDHKELARAYPHVVLLRTFSKAWGLAGLRVGYALAPDGLARQLRKLVPPFATSVLQTVAVQVALANPGYVAARVAAVVAERERLYQALQKHPTWQVYPSHANFLLIRTPDAEQAFKQLLEHGVLVRRQDSYHGLEGCIRISLGTRAENDAFLAAAGLLPAG